MPNQYSAEKWHDRPGTSKRLDDPTALEAFLNAILEHGSVAAACRELDLSYSGVYAKARTDPAFDSAVDKAAGYAWKMRIDKAGHAIDTMTPENCNVVRAQVDLMLRIAGKLTQVYADKPAQINVHNQTAIGIVCTEEQRKRLIAMREELTGTAPRPRPIEAEVVREQDTTCL